MFGVLASVLIAFLSLFVPGVLLSFVLLRKTELHTFEVVFIGFIFGLIAPAAMTWMESYLINYIHFFSFSLALFELNALILTMIGLVLAYREGMLKDFVAWARNLIGLPSNPTAGTSKQLDGVRSELSKYEQGQGGNTQAQGGGEGAEVKAAVRVRGRNLQGRREADNGLPAQGGPVQG